MNDAISQFRSAMRAAGLEPPDVIEPGKFRRFPGFGKSNGNTAAWCKLFDDGLGGCFGDWSSGLSETWQVRRDRPFSTIESEALSRHIAVAQEQADVEREMRRTYAAEKAEAIWKSAQPAPADHPYLVRKGIQPHGARIHRGVLILPVEDFTGAMTSLQFIRADGSKRLLYGGRKRGCFIRVTDNMPMARRVILCEGWATGCTLAEDEPTALVLAGIDAGNLQLVALATRARWPNIELVIAGDDDRLVLGNPGATQAHAAAVAAGALLALPRWPTDAPPDLTDFNDLAVWLTRGES